MDNLHEKINDLTQYEVNTKRIEKLKKKQVPKTKTQRLRGFFIVLTAVGFVCQFLSALLASSGVLHYVAMKLNSNGLILSMTSICILLLIEGSKRFTLESYHAQRLDDSKVNRITYFFILLFGSLSIGSTYYGTPYAVEYFAAAPELVSIDSISNNWDNILAGDKKTLERELKSHQATADSIKKAASWKGRVSRDDRPAYMAAVTAAKDAEIKLSEVTILRNEEKNKIVQSAIKENKQIVKNHSAWCMSFGYDLAAISLFLELLFFISMFWCEGYKRLEVTEATVLTKLKLKSEQLPTVTATDTNTGNTRVTETNNLQNTPRTVITAFQTAKTSNSSRTCLVCGTDISGKRSDAKFCGDKCRGSNHKSKK